MKLVNLLNEIGDSSVSPYPLGPIKTRTFGDITTYSQTFVDKNDNKFNVDGAVVINSSSSPDLAFDCGFTIGRGNSNLTNLNDQYKIMSTVALSLKRLLEKSQQDYKNNIKYIKFSVHGKSKDDIATAEKRLKLYKLYLEKEIPHIKLEIQKNGSSIIVVGKI